MFHALNHEPGEVHPGAHICGVYSSVEEKMRIVQAYFLHGLRHRHKCIYIADEQSKADVETYLVSRGIDMDHGKKWGQFEIFDSWEMYLRDGLFEADTMFSGIRSLEKQALQQGFLGCRGAGEMTWVLNDPMILQQLVSYEIMLNDTLAEGVFTALCLYNRERFIDQTLQEVLLAHPLVVLDSKLYKNKCYNQDFRGTYNELVETIQSDGH